MAVIAKRRTVVNPARRTKAKKKNPRKLSDKQIKFFGTARQKAALKARRRKPRAAQTNPKRRARRARKNSGEIVLIGNPARLKTRKATTKRRKKTTMPIAKRKNRARRSNPRAASRRAQTNPKKRRRTRTNPWFAKKTRHHRRRKNPEHDSFINLVMQAGYTVAGAVGTRALCQMLLGSNNTGVTGYAANFAAAFGLGKTVGAVTKNRNAGNLVMLGGFAAAVLRILQEFTPFGQYISSSGLSGMGDLGIYLPTTFFVPTVHNDQAGTTAGYASNILPKQIQNMAIPSAVAPKGSMGRIRPTGGRYSTRGRY